MTAVKVQTDDAARARVVRRYKLVALALLALPAALFGVFAVAEGIGLEEGWWGHVVQLALAALLAWGAWVRPRIAGPLLILAGAALAGFMVLEGNGGGALNVGGLTVVAASLAIAGLLFTVAGNQARTTSKR